MSKNPGKVDEHGLMHVMSYSAQTLWLRHQSIRESILFDSPYDEERYSQVVECCALKPDLDSAEIGVRHVTRFLDYECNRNDVIFFLGV